MVPIDPTTVPFSLLSLVVPVTAGVKSKPAMVLGTVTGVFLSLLTVAAGSSLGVTFGTLVVAVPGAFVAGFLLVGAGIAIRRQLL